MTTQSQAFIQKQRCIEKECYQILMMKSSANVMARIMMFFFFFDEELHLSSYRDSFSLLAVFLLLAVSATRTCFDRYDLFPFWVD
jgi:hypothetical protein